MRLALATALSMALAGCATTPSVPYHPEARSFDVSRTAMADVDAALERAGERGTRMLLVLGANWCHDSRAFAGWMKQPRFRSLVAERYELVFVNVGLPQTGDGHNMDVAGRFGFETLEGTPTVLVVDPYGSVLNAETARSWRNTASRSEDEIYAELSALAGA